MQKMATTDENHGEIVDRKLWTTPRVIVSQTKNAESANGSAPSDFTTSAIPYSS